MKFAMIYGEEGPPVDLNIVSDSIFLFEGTVTVPDVRNMTWLNFVTLCSEKSVSSTRGTVNNNRRMALNPSRGIERRSDTDIRQYLHTRALVGTTESTDLRSPAATQNMEEQFYSVSRPTNGMLGDSTISKLGRAVHGIDRSKAIMSVAQLNDWYIDNSFKVEMRAIRYNYGSGPMAYVNGTQLGHNQQSFVAVPANVLPLEMSYVVVLRDVLLNGVRMHWSVPTLYQPIDSGETSMSVPTWGMYATKNAQGNFSFNVLITGSFAEMVPRIDDTGYLVLRDRPYVTVSALFTM